MDSPAPAPAPGNRGPHHRALWVLLGLGALVRVCYLLWYGREVPFLDFPISDSAYYHAWALRVASGEGYGPRPFYMAPLYPTLLGLLYRLFGPHPEWVPWFQGLLGLGNTALVYHLGRSWVGPRAALIGGLLLTFHAPMVFLESKVLTETLSVFLLLSALAVGTGALAAPKRLVAFAGFGLLLGLAALARPNLLAVALLGMVWIFWRALRRRPVAPLRGVALALLCFVLTIVPVTVRNAVVGRDRVLISSNGGIVFAQGNHADASGISTILPGFTPRIEEQQDQEIRIASAALGRDVRPSESSSWWFSQGIRFATQRPLRFLSLWVRKALWALHAREPRDVYNLYQEREMVPLLHLLRVPFPLILGLALWAVTRQFRSLPDGARLGLLAAGAVLASLVVFSVSFRYRFPATPILAPFAGLGLLDLWRAIQERNRRALVHAALCVIPVWGISAIPYPLPPITAEAPANLGAAWLHRGDIPRAIAYSTRALRQDPNLASAHYNLGLAFRQAGDQARALRSLEVAARLLPEDPAVQNDLAVTLDESGRISEAIEHYRLSLQRRPDGRTAYNLALALHSQGRRAEAREALEMAQRLGIVPDPRFVRTLFSPEETSPASSP